MLLDIYEKYNADSGCKERWNRWKPHRDQINTILAKHVFAGERLKDAIILGAGRCEDIDLKLFLEHVESITLVDYDLDSMVKALERQHLTEDEKSRIALIGDIEFTGFYKDEFVNSITRYMESKEKLETVRNRIQEHLDNLKSDLFGALGNRQYALVVSGAVHSQLIVPFFDLISMDQEYGELKNQISAIANRLADNYNDDLLNLAQEGGWLLSYFDVMELSERNNALRYEPIISALIKENEDDKIENIMAQFGGVAGARHGFENLLERTKKYEIHQKSWIWYFRENKKYYVRCLCVRKHIAQNRIQRMLKI